MERDLPKVLVVRLSSLGDVALASAALASLKMAWPQARISMLVKPDYAPMLEGQPWIDEVIPFNGLLDAVRRIRTGAFTHLLDLHSTLRSWLLAASSGIPKRVRYRKAAIARRLFVYFGIVSQELRADTVERYLRALEPWGIRPEIRLPRLVPGPLRPGLALAVGSGTLVGLHPGSKWPTKRWPAPRFAELARRLSQATGARIVLVGTGQEAGICAEVAKAAPGCVDLAAQTSAADLLALMSRLSLFVTNDSGPMHLAAAAGVPTVAIFGPTTRELGFFPAGENVRIIETELACRPCTLHGDPRCPQVHFLCMRLITVDQVYEAALQLLKANASLAR